MPPHPPHPLTRLWAPLVGLLLLASGHGLRAEDPQCAVLLGQAQAMLAEAEAGAMRAQDAKAEGIALRALPLVEKAFALCPESRDAAGLGVLLAVFAHDPGRGQEWLARYTALTPFGDRDPQLHYLRAVVETRLIDRPDLAVRSLERMQALAPQLHVSQRDTLYYEALVGASASLSRQKRYPEALRMLTAAEAVARRSGKTGRARRARAMQGITLGQDERHKEAVEVFRQLHAEEPTSPVWSYQLGLSLAQMMNYDAAILAYRESIQRQPGYQDKPSVLQDLARARLRLGNCLRLKAGSMSPEVPQREQLLNESLAELTRYHELRPEDPLGALWIGVLYYEERDNPLAALPWFEKAFARDPDCETTLDYLIGAHARAGGPVPPDAPKASPEAQAAWDAKGEAWRKDRAENTQRRKAAIEERARLSGDASGGCM